MPFDDDLRERLRAEQDRLPSVAEPADVLAALRPEMRRARRLRRLTHAGVGALLVVAGIGAARIGAGDGDGSLQIVPAGAVDEPIALAPEVSSISTSGTATSSSVIASVPRSSDAPADAPPSTEADAAVPDVDAVPEPPPAAVVAIDSGDPPVPSRDTTPDGDTGPVQTSPLDTAPLETAPLDTAPPDTAPPDTVPPDTAPDQPPATAPPTTAASSAPTRFDSACGYVLADVSGGAVTIVEIVPGTGYHAKVEDPDHGSITVHFEGAGEDCELKIR